jgi:hypothetical protein
MGGENKQAGDRGMRLGGVALVVFVIGVAVFSRLGGDAGAEGPSDAGAIDVCHQAVEAQLKAPGTAEFGGDNTVAETSRRYQVDGHVDAENSFGATLRLDWTCEAVWSLDEFWDPVTATVTE